MAAENADRMPFKYNGRIEGWRLCAEPQVNLADRWFCRLVEDKITDYSMFCGARSIASLIMSRILVSTLSTARILRRINGE